MTGLGSRKWWFWKEVQKILLSAQDMGFQGMLSTPLVIVFSLCGAPEGTLGPIFLWGPVEYRDNIQFTSSRWFLKFWEANESSGCSLQKCTESRTLCLAQSFRGFTYSWKSIHESLDQYLDVNNESLIVVAVEPWARPTYPGGEVAQ